VRCHARRRRRRPVTTRPDAAGRGRVKPGTRTTVRDAAGGVCDEVDSRDEEQVQVEAVLGGEEGGGGCGSRSCGTSWRRSTRSRRRRPGTTSIDMTYSSSGDVALVPLAHADGLNTSLAWGLGPV
jgi:hypothetical protein